MAIWVAIFPRIAYLLKILVEGDNVFYCVPRSFMSALEGDIWVCVESCSQNFLAGCSIVLNFPILATRCSTDFYRLTFTCYLTALTLNIGASMRMFSIPCLFARFFACSAASSIARPVLSEPLFWPLKSLFRWDKWLKDWPMIGLRGDAPVLPRSSLLSFSSLALPSIIEILVCLIGIEHSSGLLSSSLSSENYLSLRFFFLSTLVSSFSL